jgi:S-adenosylmethionine:tRNA ribosyltransferase-isomerase
VEPEIKISDYSYNLPEEKIAKYPLPERDSSKLLIYKNGKIESDIFASLSNYLPENSLMVINRTKVVAARLIFRKESGAFIEIFCLEPYLPAEYNSAFASKGKSLWKCVVGNIKRLKEEYVYLYSVDDNTANVELKARLIERIENEAIIEFCWNESYEFSEVLEICGRIPIPPYLKRESESSDNERYQTIYAVYKGSVAAPTAGLHFTERVFNSLKNKNIEISELSLHVGAGTFVPVKSELVSDHTMHSEPFSVSRGLVEMLTKAVGERDIIAVGTTSARTLESLYYLGVKCINGENPEFTAQWEPYSGKNKYDTKEALEALCRWLENNNRETLEARTQIIIVPGFKFRICNILVTNFHQPQSTLLLLISAFIGDGWRSAYDYALENNFRFLSYGDSCLLFRK